MTWTVRIDFSVSLPVEGEGFMAILDAATELVEEALGAEVERAHITHIERVADDA